MLLIINKALRTKGQYLKYFTGYSRSLKNTPKNKQIKHPNRRRIATTYNTSNKKVKKTSPCQPKPKTTPRTKD